MRLVSVAGLTLPAPLSAHAPCPCRWEEGLDEFKKDLMELFIWTTFQTSLNLDGEAVGRENLIKLSKVHVA